MAGILQPRLRLPLVIAVTALAAWLLLPGTAIERAALHLAVKSFANPPFFITGGETRGDGWQVRTVSSQPSVDPQHAPLVISLGDDPDGVFQTSPPSAIDMAVILANLHRLGVKRPSLAAVLAWDDPDPIGLAALDRAIGRFDSLAMTAPLTRGAVAEPLPPAFRRASLPVNAVHGEISYLPIVNRVPLGGVILGGERTLAGFQTLASEPATQWLPLLARWDDRIVLAMPLLAAMQAHGITPDDLEIQLGSHLRLGKKGPVVPIDRHGRLAVAVADASDARVIDAAELIDAPEDFLTENPHAAAGVVLRDERPGAEASTRAFSAALAGALAVMAGDAGLEEPRIIARPMCCRQLVLLSLFCVALGFACRLPAFARHIAFAALAGMCVIAQIAAAGAGYWGPGLAAMAALVVAFIVCQTPVLAAYLPANPQSNHPS